MKPLTVLEGLPELRPPEAENLAGKTDEELSRAHLSHSSLNAQLACQQKYGYEYVDCIAPISKGAPQRMGAAFAKGLELGDPEAGIREVVEKANVLSQADEDRTRIEGITVGAAIKAYLGAYGQTDPDEREFAYRVRLRNPATGAYSRTFDLLGYADQLQAGDDAWTLIEDKLVGTIQTVAVKRLPLDRQLALTCYGIWRATGKPVTEVRYRFTRKPSIKQKQSETLDQFLDRLQVDYETRPEFYLHEETLTRTTDDLARTEAELWQWAAQRREADRQRIYPRNSSHCHDYGGCAFLSLCIGDPDAPALYGPKPESDRVSNNNQEVPA
ncbi:MAG TPA: PD-(D/E)XK nuclease family protein [Solirubrobacterales bacterium]|jgi:hypothetical protein